MTNAELVRQGMAFNRPLLAVRTDDSAGPSRPLLSLDNEAIVATALLQAAHSDNLLVRFSRPAANPARRHWRCPGQSIRPRKWIFWNNQRARNSTSIKAA
jgi:hypothetical protein